MAPERVRLGGWKPGQSGKGFLLAGDPPILRLWRTDPYSLAPHHREAIQTLARTYDDVAAYVTILPPSRVLVMAGSLGETEATRLILALDPRLTASEEAD